MVVIPARSFALCRDTILTGTYEELPERTVV